MRVYEVTVFFIAIFISSIVYLFSDLPFMGIIGYGVLLVIIMIFLRYPYYGVIAAFLTKPIIDMAWGVKYTVVTIYSPLYIAGIGIPLIALLMGRGYATKTKVIRNPHDKMITAYLVIFGILTLLKIINSPLYVMNSLDSYMRIASCTVFYFIGKYYFSDEQSQKQLVWAILLSAIVPFLFSLSPAITGKTVFIAQGVDVSNIYSSYYVPGRHDLQRISGVYSGVYELAFMSLFVIMMLLAVKQSTERFPFWGYILFPLGAYYLYFTYSRSAWLLFLFGFILYSIYRKNINQLIVFFCCAVAFYLLIPNVQYRFEDELGFVLGEKEFHAFGYSRGGLWMNIWDQFQNQDIIPQLIGNYGLGNAENQFLGLLIWFGYVGLITFILLIVYLTAMLGKEKNLIRNDASLASNMKYLFISLLIGSYWVAGLGNQFNMMISVQWILWTWTGIILNGIGTDLRPSLSSTV